jgi:hypothetical protein
MPSDCYKTNRQTNKQTKIMLALMMCVRITLSGISGMAWTRRAYLLQTCVEEELHPPAGEKAKRKFQNAPNTCMMSVHSNLWNHCDITMFLYCSLSTKSSTFFYKLLLFPFYSIAVHRPKQQQGRPSIEREREREREIQQNLCHSGACMNGRFFCKNLKKNNNRRTFATS